MRRARSFHKITATPGGSRVAVGACLLLVLGVLAGVSPADATPPQGTATAPVLGTAAGFSVLAGPSIANTGTGTVLALDLGVSGTIGGFPPGTVTGTTHQADTAVATAQADRQTAYDAVVAQTGGTTFSGDQAGKTFTPGLYTSTAAMTNTGTITLDAGGDPNGVFVFQIGAAMSSAAATKVLLTNGALANNVYWQVVGAVSLGANVHWVGTMLGAGAVAFGDGASLKGRILTPSTVALANSPITKPIDDLTPPVVTINGGPTRSTNDTTPSVSGTTDEPGTPLVTVTIGSQVLTTRASAGAWSVSADALTPGTHTVVGSVTDPSQNTGTATQALTVDTSAPAVTIAGGANRATNDTTPTISGTTDEPGTPTVTVTVDSQTLTTMAGPGGAWSVDAGALTESSHSVHASVTDAAGNTGTASQVLTVDITTPVLTIDGGATQTTSDTSPWIRGTTAEQAGTIVNLSVGGQDFPATVSAGGQWKASADTLSSGTYTVLASITDAAQNTGRMTQTLQVGSIVTPPIAPSVTPTAAVATYRPDAEIRLAGHSFVGKDIYAVTHQRVTSKLKGHPAKTTTFTVRMTNRGNVAERMTVGGTRKSTTFTVAYLQGHTNVTTAVLDGSYRSGTLKPLQSATLTVKVTKVKRARTGSTRTFHIRVASAHAPKKVDTVAAVLQVTRG